MVKEIIIIIIVVTLVICLDVITNNYTKSTVEELSGELSSLKEEVLEENEITSKSKMQKIKDSWKEKYNVLAYYIEHDELEKVETELTKLAADIDVGEYKHCINELYTIIFILNHIKQKEEFNIKSIF